MNFKSIFSLWKNSVLNPKETFAKEKANASVKKGILFYFIAFFVSILIYGMQTLPNQIISGRSFAPPAEIAIGILLFAVIALAAAIFTILGQGILFIIAKILGGKGTIIQQYYLVSLYTAPLTILAVLIYVMPVIGLLSIIILLYELYLLTLALAEIHEYGMGKAVLTWIFPVLLGVLEVLAKYG